MDSLRRARGGEERVARKRAPHPLHFPINTDGGCFVLAFDRR